jgi:hypothetical protein
VCFFSKIKTNLWGCYGRVALILCFELSFVFWSSFCVVSVVGAKAFTVLFVCLFVFLGGGSVSYEVCFFTRSSSARRFVIPDLI